MTAETHDPFLGDNYPVVEWNLPPALLSLDSFRDDIVELSLREQWPSTHWLLSVGRDSSLNIHVCHDDVLCFTECTSIDSYRKNRCRSKLIYFHRVRG